MQLNKVKHFSLNTSGRDFVVGDIHGMFSLVEEKLRELNFNENTDRLFSVGDNVDRGTESSKVLEWLAKPWFHSVRGNHCQMIIDAHRIATDERVMHSFQNGGAWWFSLLPSDRLEYVEAFESLPYLIEVETKDGLVGIVHAEVETAGWEYTKTFVNMNDKYTLEKCLWARTRIKSKETKPISGIHKLYVGHTPMEKVTELGNVVFIDTGAVYDDGYLTILQIN